MYVCTYMSEVCRYIRTTTASGITGMSLLMLEGPSVFKKPALELPAEGLKTTSASAEPVSVTQAMEWPKASTLCGCGAWRKRE